MRVSYTVASFRWASEYSTQLFSSRFDNICTMTVDPSLIFLQRPGSGARQDVRTADVVTADTGNNPETNLDDLTRRYRQWVGRGSANHGSNTGSAVDREGQALITDVEVLLAKIQSGPDAEQLRKMHDGLLGRLAKTAGQLGTQALAGGATNLAADMARHRLQSTPLDGAPTSLMTERLGDGHANCVEKATMMADPNQDVVFMRDNANVDGNDAGHALIRDPKTQRVWDPNDGPPPQSALDWPHETVDDWVQKQGLGADCHPRYETDAALPANEVRRLLEKPPAERGAHIERLRDTDPELAAKLDTIANRRYADSPGALPAEHRAKAEDLISRFSAVDGTDRTAALQQRRALLDEASTYAEGISDPDMRDRFVHAISRDAGAAAGHVAWSSPADGYARLDRLGQGVTPSTAQALVDGALTTPGGVDHIVPYGRSGTPVGDAVVGERRERQRRLGELVRDGVNIVRPGLGDLLSGDPGVPEMRRGRRVGGQRRRGTPGNPVIREDSRGNIISVSAQITKRDLGTGTPTTNASRREANRNAGNIPDDAGHIIGAALGGRGGARARNFFAQNPHVNRGEFRDFEGWIADQVRAGRRVEVEINPKYHRGTNSGRPHEVEYNVRVDNQVHTRTFNNPLD